MSSSGVWTAIRGKEKTDVLRELGLQRADVQAEGGLVGALLPSGWYVITVSLRSAEDPCAHVLAKLSSGCEVLTFAEVESTGYKQAAGWKDGSQIWSMICDPDESDELAIEGTPPSGAGADLDVLELSKSLTGFRPDEGCSEPSEVLARSTGNVAKKSSWLAKLFGN
jgi:hypothetical protein